MSADAYGRSEHDIASVRAWVEAQRDLRLTAAVAKLADDASAVGLHGQRALRLELGLARLRETGAPIDVAYDDASDVSSIRYRLHPLDVGWDLRGECSRVEIDFAAPRLRVSYARRRDGERRVIEGPATAVIAWLRREGYRIVEARS